MSARIWIFTMIYLATSIVFGACIDVWRINETWQQMAKMDRLLAELKDLKAQPADGRLGAVAGCLGDSYLFRRWFEEGAQGDPPLFRDESSEGLLVTGEIVEWVGHGGKRFSIVADFHAIGSGFRIALGAMAAGVGAEAAVKIACSMDENTRAPIHVQRLRG
jgi:hypothetical protein